MFRFGRKIKIDQVDAGRVIAPPPPPPLLSYKKFIPFHYSRTPLTLTLKRNEKLFELVGVRVNGGDFRLLD